MRLPARFRVRTLMALVALVALGLGVAFELRNHAERDLLLRWQAENYRQAATHFKRAIECKYSDERQLPYDLAARAKLISGDGVRTFLPPGGFRSWEAELSDHLYWGTRLSDQVDGLHLRVKAIEARMLFRLPKWR